MKQNPLTITTQTCLSTVQSIQAHDTRKNRKTLKPHLNAYAAVVRIDNTYKVHGRQSTTNKQENKQYKYALKQKWHNKQPRFRDTRKSKQKTQNKKQKKDTVQHKIPAQHVLDLLEHCSWSQQQALI